MEKSSYVLGSVWESNFDGLLSLVIRNYNYYRCEGSKKTNYMKMTQNPVNNSILGLHLGRGIVSSVRMVS